MPPPNSLPPRRALTDTQAGCLAVLGLLLAAPWLLAVALWGLKMAAEQGMALRQILGG